MNTVLLKIIVAHGMISIRQLLRLSKLNIQELQYDISLLKEYITVQPENRYIDNESFTNCFVSVLPSKIKEITAIVNKMYET